MNNNEMGKASYTYWRGEGQGEPSKEFWWESLRETWKT